MKIVINLNDSVKLKLTGYGKEVYQRKHEEINEWCKRRGGRATLKVEPRVDENGYTSMQLWDFMNTFGDELYMGNKNVIFPLTLEYETGDT